jgi:predicted HAD superfamily phosphohydrolase
MVRINHLTTGGLSAAINGSIYAFRSRKVAVSFPSPEKRKISADIKR